jgi:predicted Zn-ribbon and HTH transcriptional regulator
MIPQNATPDARRGAMKQRPRKPVVPRPAEETLRRAIGELLLDEPLSAREISVRAHLMEKEVYGHLEHIRHSLHARDSYLEVTPAQCRSCGFVFGKRERLAPPGKCPICRSETIFEPLFAIRQRQEQSA